jgi:hypothetical protein
MFDGLHHAFLWDVGDRISSAKCLVAWDAVCRSKDEGGSSVRALVVQNSCLLMKILHRLHVQTATSWVR